MKSKVLAVIVAYICGVGTVLLVGGANPLDRIGQSAKGEFQSLPLTIVNGQSLAQESTASVAGVGKAANPVRGSAIPARPQQGLDQIIAEASRIHQIPAQLIRAVIKVESDGDRFAVSPKGAKGIMQLMDTTADELGVCDPFDIRDNVMGGTKYLRQLMDQFGDPALALAAYNCGPGTVRKAGGIPAIPETVEYVGLVAHYYNHDPLNNGEDNESN